MLGNYIFSISYNNLHCINCMKELKISGHTVFSIACCSYTSKLSVRIFHFIGEELRLSTKCSWNFSTKKIFPADDFFPCRTINCDRCYIIRRNFLETVLKPIGIYRHFISQPSVERQGNLQAKFFQHIIFVS